MVCIASGRSYFRLEDIFNLGCLTSFNKVKNTIGWAWVTFMESYFIKDCIAWWLIRARSIHTPPTTMSAFPVSTIEIFGKKKSFDTFWSFPYMISLFLCIIDLFQMWIHVFLTPKKKMSYFNQKWRIFFWNIL